MHFLSMRFGCLALFLLLLLGTETLTAETSRFTDLGNGTVLDNQTGLMWQKGDSYHELKKGMNWYEALEYIDKKIRKNTEASAIGNSRRLRKLKRYGTPSARLLVRTAIPSACPKCLSVVAVITYGRPMNEISITPGTLAWARRKIIST